MNEPLRRTLTELRGELEAAEWSTPAFHRLCDVLDHHAAQQIRKGAAREAGKPVRSSRSKRRARVDPPELTESKRVVRERSGGRCEARTAVCDGLAVHVHHKAGRRGKGCHAPERLLHVCEPCHLEIHANPTRSYAAGWLEKRLGVAS